MLKPASLKQKFVNSNKSKIKMLEMNPKVKLTSFQSDGTLFPDYQQILQVAPERGKKWILEFKRSTVGAYGA